MSKKLFIILASLALLSVTYTAALRDSEQEDPSCSGNLIRLHVVANSDSPGDQELKRKIRDKIVLQVAPEFLKAGDIQTARTIALANLDHIEAIAAREIIAAGKDYPVRAELNSFAFPTKHYGYFVLPAGDYEAVRVVIGAGGGSNWWCVLFPPLCFVDLTRAAASPPGEINLPPAEPGPAAAPGGTPLSETNPPPAAATAAVAGETEITDIKVEFRIKIVDLFNKYFG